jgi:pilus assembly protein CpaB
VDAKVGPLVPVVAAKRDIAPDEPIRLGDMAVTRVPARFMPPDAFGAPARLAGARVAVPVAAGAYITSGLLQGAGAPGEGPLKPGERALEIAVTGGAALALAGPGSRVDVLVSTQPHDGAGRSFVALEDVALLDLSPASGSDLAAEEPAGTEPATALATLRVTARQAVYLTAAETFAREVRLLLRPPGDHRRTGTVAVAEGEL